VLLLRRICAVRENVGGEQETQAAVCWELARNRWSCTRDTRKVRGVPMTLARAPYRGENGVGYAREGDAYLARGRRSVWRRRPT